MRPPNYGSWWLGSAVDHWLSSGPKLPNMEERHRTAETERSSSSRKQGKPQRREKRMAHDQSLGPLGQSLLTRTPHMPEITSKVHRCQFGALPCGGTREAILLVKAWHDTRKAHNVRCARWLCCCVDLQKAFDCIPRDRAFSKLAKLRGRMTSS